MLFHMREGFAPEFSFEPREKIDPRVEQRERVVGELNAIIDAWVKVHLPDGKECTQSDLKILLHTLEAQHRESIDLIVTQMKDRGLFPEARPSVELFRAEERLPRVILYGWRKDANLFAAPRPHDHGKSLGGMAVLEGALRESVFGIDKDEWSAHEESKRPHGYFFLKNFGSKTIPAGKSKTFRAPYIHEVEAHPSFDFSSSLHAYAGEKGSSANYQVQGEELILVERK